MGVRVRGLRPWASPGGTRHVRVGEVTNLPHLLASRLEDQGIVERLDPSSRRRPRAAPEAGPQETPTAVEEYHVGGGWFRPPGSDRAMRRDEALALLRSSRGRLEGDGEA